MKARGWLLAASAAAVVLTAVLWWTPGHPDRAADGEDRVLPAGGGTSLMSAGGADLSQPPPPDAAAGKPVARTPEQTRDALFEEGSLRGASLDGGWGTWTGQRLMPSLALRQRFDQLLSTVGEASPDELRALVEWQATADLGAAGARAVLQIWDNYVRLQQHAFKQTLDLERPEQWAQVLQEHQHIRRILLGPSWAEQFYREEEDRFQRMAQRRLGQVADAPTASTALLAPPPAGADPASVMAQRAAAFGAEAAERLRTEDELEARWADRLREARQALARIRQAPELSQPQREQAIENTLQSRFSGPEQLRARTLLGL